MTSFLNRCIWNPTAGGLTDFTVAGAFTGGYTPAQCLDPVVVDGATYHYFAQTSDNSQHEEGDGVYSVATSTLTRATIRNSSSGGSKVNFGQVPIVTMGGPTALDIGPAGPNGAVQYNNSGSYGGFGIYTPSTHTLQLDAADSSSPNNQTIAAQNALVGTLDANGASISINAGMSTGVGSPGIFNINTGFIGFDVGKTLSSISQASPAVFTTAVPHNLQGNQTILLQTTGTLPAPLATLTTYYIDTASLTSTTFEVATTLGGTPITTTSAGSGTHSYVPGAVTSHPVPGILFTTNNHGLITPGIQIQFQTTGVLPVPLLPNTNYFIAASNPNNFVISATLGGGTISCSTAGTGTLTYQIQGGTTQNPLLTTVLYGPRALLGANFTPAMQVLQNWGTVNEPSGGLVYNINNFNFATQDTIYNAFVANQGNVESLNFFSPAGGNSWRIGQAGPFQPVLNYIDFNANGAVTLFGTLPTILNTSIQPPAQSTQTGNYSQTINDRCIVFNGGAGITLTLLNPATYPGLELWVKNIANQTVVSAGSNVIPQVGGAAGTAILAATAGKFALLKSNGTNWEIIASN